MITKVLFFGLGSIGLRHLEVLKSLGCFEIGAYRTCKGNKQISEEIGGSVRYFYDEAGAFAWDPDYMVVSNPTSLHAEYLMKAIDHNIDALIEKPVVNDCSDIEKFEEKIRKRQNRICVGFNLRFHCITKKIREIIDTESYGKALKAQLYVGNYLPLWHPYEDYTKSYASRKELGGGVLKTLSHEIDLGQYWFGDYSSIFATVDKISHLNIDVDDSVDIIATMKNGTKLTIAMDYLNPLCSRYGSIFFEKGVLSYNFQMMNLEFTDNSTKETSRLLKKSTGNYDYDAPYRSQMDAFINKHEGEICSLEDAIKIVNITSKCEESSKTRRVVDV